MASSTLTFNLLPDGTTAAGKICTIHVLFREYPPDANHGHYVGSAIVTTQLPVARNYTSIPLSGCKFSDSFNASRKAYILTIRSETLILSLPTPDFSMPYNVICLACTVVALAFGPIHSVATKRIVVEQQDSDDSNSFVGKILKRFKRSKKQEPQTDHEIINEDNTCPSLTDETDA